MTLFFKQWFNRLRTNIRWLFLSISLLTILIINWGQWKKNDYEKMVYTLQLINHNKKYHLLGFLLKKYDGWTEKSYLLIKTINNLDGNSRVTYYNSNEKINQSVKILGVIDGYYIGEIQSSKNKIYYWNFRFNKFLSKKSLNIGLNGKINPLDINWENNSSTKKIKTINKNHKNYQLINESNKGLITLYLINNKIAGLIINNKIIFIKKFFQSIESIKPPINFKKSLDGVISKYKNNWYFKSTNNNEKFYGKIVSINNEPGINAIINNKLLNYNNIVIDNKNTIDNHIVNAIEGTLYNFYFYKNQLSFYIYKSEKFSYYYYSPLQIIIKIIYDKNPKFYIVDNKSNLNKTTKNFNIKEIIKINNKNITTLDEIIDLTSLEEFTMDIKSYNKIQKIYGYRLNKNNYIAYFSQDKYTPNETKQKN